MPRARRRPIGEDATPGWTLHVGSCLSEPPKLPDKSIDVVITDPPYEPETHTSERRVARAGGRLEVEPISFPPITEEERVESSRQMARLARRWILVFCQIEGAMKWRAALEAAGAVYKRTCIWVKPDGKPQYSGDRPGTGYEGIVACHARGRSTWNGGGSHGVYVVSRGNEPRTGHQTQKPLALMETLVRLFSDHGELILDPYAGSGSTGVAAIRLGRRSLGWEMDPGYAEIARKRLTVAREQLQLSL
jgi:site-specific DNA-methyltransferase (adenine-specific)